MKIALIGYGKMGREIESVAIASGHEIVVRINSENLSEFSPKNLSLADVAIEFTRPDQVISNLYTCFEASVPVVTGTTGWYENIQKVQLACEKLQGSLIFASNFSIGVQVFFQINSKLAAIIKNLPEYQVDIEEIHHVEKLDKPSGTAISLALEIMKNLPEIKKWQPDDGNRTLKRDEIPIRSIRKDQVIGTHIVNYTSEIDRISLIHDAKSRKGFAIGALAAATWLIKRKGFFTMNDFMQDVFFSDQAGK